MHTIAQQWPDQSCQEGDSSPNNTLIVSRWQSPWLFASSIRKHTLATSRSSAKVSNIKLATSTCNIAIYCSNLHPMEMAGEKKLIESDYTRNLLQFIILVRAVDDSLVTHSRLEEIWRNHLWMWFLFGQNTGDDDPKEVWKKEFSSFILLIHVT